MALDRCSGREIREDPYCRKEEKEAARSAYRRKLRSLVSDYRVTWPAVLRHLANDPDYARFQGMKMAPSECVEGTQRAYGVHGSSQTSH